MAKVLIEDDRQWHELRRRNVGGSDIGALFDCSPWVTQFMLWNEKVGVVEHEVEENQRMKLGKFLEEFIATELGSELGWTIVRSKEYHLHPTIAGMAATLDFDVRDHQWGDGIVETKCVFSYADYQEHWADDRAPPHIELQVQHQLAVTGRSWAAIAVLVMETGTIMPAIIRRPIPAVISEIELKIGMFWQSIKERRRPEPTGTDAELSIMRLIWPAREPGKVVEIPSDDLSSEASLYVWASTELAGMERQKTASKAKLLAAAEDAELLKVPGYAVRIKQDKRGFIRMTVEAATHDLAPQPVRSTLDAG